MARGLLILSVAGVLAAQIGPPVSPNGTITGVVTDGSSGAPLAEVLVSSGGANAIRSTTDQAGQYKLTGLPPGSYRLSADLSGRLTYYKYTHLDPGQSVTLDLHIAAEPSISGNVIDERQNAIAGVNVLVIQSEYRAGVLRHVVVHSETSGREGQFAFSKGLETGREYVLLALRNSPSADAPIDRAQRKAVVRPTYFPESPTLEGALPISLQPGERREHVNIRMPEFKPYCVDGTLTAAGRPTGAGLRVESEAVLGLPVFLSSAAANGHFRTCGFTTGAYSVRVAGDQLEGVKDFAITDSDLHAVNIAAEAAVPPRLEVVWDTPPPPGMQVPYLHLDLDSSSGHAVVSMDRSFPFSGAFGTPIAPGEYEVRTRLGDGLYVKHMTYGGAEVLQHMLRISGAEGNTLRIDVGRDGSNLALTVNDSDGHPVPEASVVVLPEGVTSVPLLSARMIVGFTNQAGVYNSPTLAPGTYSVLACGRPLRASPEELAKLFDARSKAQSVDLIARSTATVTIQPTTIE